MKATGVREKIVDTAGRLFFAQGYNSTGINQIIDEADIAKGSLYNHFSSKGDLLVASLQQAEIKWFDELNVFLKNVSSPKGRLLGICDFRIARQKKSNFGGCRFIKVSAEVPKDEAEVFAAVAHNKGLLKNYIRQLVDATVPSKNRSLPSDLLSENIFLIMEGASVTDAINKNMNAMENAKKIIGKLL